MATRQPLAHGPINSTVAQRAQRCAVSTDAALPEVRRAEDAAALAAFDAQDAPADPHPAALAF